VTSRERIDAVFHGRQPDKIPVDFSSRSTAIEIEAYDRLKQHLGINSPTRRFLRDHAVLDQQVIELFQIDTEFVRSFGEEMYRIEGGDIVFRDEWGVDWRKRAGGHYFELDNRLFGDKTLEEIEWPETIVTSLQLEDMARQARDLSGNANRAVFCDYVGPCVFERSWYLRGLDDFLVELLTEEAFAHAYMERVTDIQIAAYGAIIDALGDSIEGFFVIDDIAIQSGPMMSPDTYRSMIKPYHKRIFDFLHRHDKRIIYHSCGSVIALIPDLLEIGIDALNPLQLSADHMDPVQLKQEFGKDVVFWGGGCSTQSTLAFGSAQDVRDEVRYRMDILAKDGRYVFSAEHCIQPGTPVENILALSETVNSL
jgi:uroporphyrinogen decarboxylase